MGAWGTSPFDNDYGLDWMHEVIDSGNLAPISELYDEIESEQEYLDADLGTAAIVAGEILAAFRGNPGEVLPEELLDFVSDNDLVVDDALVARAVRALDRTEGPGSELAELWGESEEYNREWRTGIENLRSRLSR